MRSDYLVTSSKKKWIVHNNHDQQEVNDISNELGISPFFVQICMQRGLHTAKDIRHFISIDETWFHDPYLMYDMEKAIGRIHSALESNELITVYGDYDADGMTSTAVLVEALESLGANVNYYLPSRFVEGYGPNVEAFEKIIENGTNLIVTVDNGVAGHEAIEHAKHLGVDVIVTDHHELPKELPDAYAIIHPAHPKGTYPFKDLAGVGVTLKLVHALIGELPVEQLDLAAIGTVADLVSLTDENRAIVYFGLKWLEQTQRIGLIQLLYLIGKKPYEVTEETIGFQIAPRLNAVGRLGDANPCVELLITHDIDRAREISEFVDQTNEERKQIVEEMTEEVIYQLNGNIQEEVIVLANKEWHQGVLGIVASRVVEKTNKPTLLFTIDEETNLAKGSARSIEGFNIFEAFMEVDFLFEQFGGHSMAAGMTAEVEKLDDIRRELSLQLKERNDIEMHLLLDSYVDLSHVTVDAIKELDSLRPFGTGNEKPLVAAKDTTVLQKRSVGANGNHLKLLVEQNDAQLDIISFQNGYVNDFLFEQQNISVAGYLEVNEWNGTSKPQLQMIDLDIPGPVLIDNRTNRLSEEMFQYEQTDFIFFNKNHAEKFIKFIPDTSECIILNSLEETEIYKTSNNMVIVDCPKSIQAFHLLLTNNKKNLIRCYFYKENHLFLSGLPTREDFSKAYRFFAKYKDIDLTNQGHILIQKLNMDKNKLFLIVKVFLEAKFVIMDNGVLNIVKHPEKQDIKGTKTYIKALEQFKAEELFIYSSFQEVIAETISK